MIRPIYLYGATDRQKEILRDAKIKLELKFQCQFVEALPEQGGRVLAFQEPPFICNQLNPLDVTPEDAVLWAAGVVDLDAALDYAGVLSKWLGAEVREVT